MIVSKELRGVNGLETYPAYDGEKEFPERIQKYIGGGTSESPEFAYAVLDTILFYYNMT